MINLFYFFIDSAPGEAQSKKIYQSKKILLKIFYHSYLYNRLSLLYLYNMQSLYTSNVYNIN